MNRISFKGIIVGLLASLLLDIVIGIVSVLLLIPFHDRMSPQEMHEATSQVVATPRYLLFSVLAGTLTTILGGYIAGRIGKQAPFLNAAIVGGVGLLVGLSFIGDYPMWFNIVGLGVVMPASLYGGHLANLRHTGAGLNPLTFLMWMLLLIVGPIVVMMIVAG